MRKLLPLILALAGLAAGAGAGIALRPAPEAGDAHGEDGGHAGEDGHAAEDGKGAKDGHDGAHPPPADPSAEPEFVKLSNQFVVPVVEDGRVAAMVILSLSLEVRPGSTEAVFSREPRLRDAFLQVLFDHANAGGFDGVFTSGEVLLGLRRTLRDTALREIGPAVHDVLITELLRQESG